MVYASPEAYDEYILNNIYEAAIIAIIHQFDRMNRGILKTNHFKLAEVYSCESTLAQIANLYPHLRSSISYYLYF